MRLVGIAYAEDVAGEVGTVAVELLSAFAFYDNAAVDESVVAFAGRAYDLCACALGVEVHHVLHACESVLLIAVGAYLVEDV